MGNSNKRYERDRTDTIRIYKEDWLTVDKVTGEDRPLKEGFHEIVEKYKEYENMEEADLSGVLGE